MPYKDRNSEAAKESRRRAERAYEQRNKAQRLEKKKSNRQSRNKETYNAKMRDYRARNPDIISKSNRSRHERFVHFINDWKLGKPCLDCGSVFPPQAMDFDHITGTKERNIAQMTGYSEQVILAEIAKCELVCSNCHRLRTFNRRNKSNRPTRVAFLNLTNKLKASARCLDCGGVFHPCVMDFDHVGTDKRYNVSSMREGYSLDEIDHEIEKCEIVCSNCHRMRTYYRSHLSQPSCAS